jgi:hypothetical protein
MEHNVKMNSNGVKWTELAPGFVENVMNLNGSMKCMS